MVAGGQWVCSSGGWIDGISHSPQHISVYRTTFTTRNTGLSCISTFGPHQSVPLLECGGLHGGFITTSSLEYTTVLSSLPFLLPLTVLPLWLSPPLLLHPVSLPLHLSPPTSVLNLPVATVGNSPTNRTVALPPMICVLW